MLIHGGRNTIIYEQDSQLREKIFRLFSTGNSPEAGAGRLRDLLCCLPRLDAPSELGCKHVLRVILMQFIDAYTFDVRSVKKTCVHVVHAADGRLIPFDTYNLFYGDKVEEARLRPLREEVAANHRTNGAEDARATDASRDWNFFNLLNPLNLLNAIEPCLFTRRAFHGYYSPGGCSPGRRLHRHVSDSRQRAVRRGGVRGCERATEPDSGARQ